MKPPSADWHPATAVRGMLVRKVREIFHDTTSGEGPVARSPEALFPPDSVIWRVHGDVTTMTVGGVSALLLQMLHPAALTGVWEHSRFRDDMQGRLRRTARFIAVTTYAGRTEAEAAIARVRDIHERVRGTLADGSSYAASDPRLLAWIHVCEATSFLDAWIAFAEPTMTIADQDRYFAQIGTVARRLGAEPVPQTRTEAKQLLASFRPELRADARTREVARLIMSQPAPSLAMAPAQSVVMRAAVTLLPRWARRMHGYRNGLLPDIAARSGAYALAETLRWAFRAPVAS
ncbi:oxygenase MpaB family protein [Novosphingobium panipatense]|uniref:Uncharacterized conserved protein, DUF2236 family n=2 Tax=Novosphingobium panipatense TaxID=428991 RepID=A0ABY1QVE7_9SPHN|nr:oxygenase MpaB family protein [Novosphingobium panipatense]SMP81898.1 Uncharacterized conserved protein, DUF2236 family [Novosphingobium panipatense]